MDERTAAVAALLTAGYGTKRSVNLLKNFSSFSEYVSASPSDFDRRLFSSQDMAVLTKPDIRAAEKIIKECDSKNISVISFYDKEYPDTLRNIPEPPLVLFTRGNPLPHFTDSPSISMVGTRDAKEQYLKFAAMNGFSLAVLGFTVVSGFAPGIDTFSLKGALFAGGKTVCVFPCGVDVLPRQADPNLISVLHKYGTIVSEYPPGTPVRLWQYSKRNRLISGMTQSTLVVEAGIESGALSTAEYAFEQGKTVYAVPDEPYDPRSEGGNFLIRNGGVLASSFLDIVEDYNKKYGYGIDPSLYREQLSRGFNSTPAIAVPNSMLTEKPEKEAKKKLKHSSPKKLTPSEEKAPEIKAETALPQSLTEGEKAAMALIKTRPVTTDDLCESLGLSFMEAIEVLSSLTDKGLIQESAGGVYNLLTE